jgi:hypothetical protein
VMTVITLPARLRPSASPAPRRGWQGRRAPLVALGAVWLLDAALQFQPYMFTKQFVTGTILPAAAGDPGIVARPVTWAAHLMIQHIAVYNTLFAVAQLAIGLGLLFRGTAKAALAASVAWSAFVWFFGEGLGGLLTGGSPLAGLPGAVLIYALIAVLLWPGASASSRRTLAILSWMALWALLGCYQLWPANRAPGGVSGVFAAAAAGEPGWLRSLETHLAGLSAGHGLIVSVLIYLLCLAAGLGVVVRRLARPALLIGGLLGAMFWVAEAFGGIATGQATDPNSGPLLILLAACLWPIIGETIDAGMPGEVEGGADDVADRWAAAGAACPAGWSSARAERRRARAVVGSAAHPDRAWRHRQDQAGTGRGERRTGAVPAGCVLGRAGAGR